MTSAGKQTKLNGLVLAGGKSSRMGEDKSKISWHGKEQRYFMADMLKDFCNEVFISCRPDQKNEIQRFYNAIADEYPGGGPLGAIASAFQKQPAVAWLIVACDQPLLNIETLSELIANRDTSKVATAFKSPFDGLPEPLVAIWEPAAFTLVMTALSSGKQCPRKVLLQSEIHMIDPKQPLTLLNANTPADKQAVYEQLQQTMVSNG
jgi:molybdopterin-guanine dinucleotide biosynthesis protein A